MNHTIVLTTSNPLLKGHEVHGRHVLPGLAYIDLLYQLLAKTHPDYFEFELSNLVIYEPVIVGQGERVVLTVAWNEEGSGSWRIEISGRHERDGAAAGATRRYVSGRMTRTGAPVFGEMLDMEQVRRSASVDLEDIYAECRRYQLTHSGRMKAQGRRYTTDSGTHVECEVSAGGVTRPQDFIFDPALIDAGAVAAGWGLGSARQGAAHEEGDARLVLPMSFESFRARAPLRARCVTRLQLSSVRRKNDLSYAVLEFFDAQGAKVAELANIATRPVPEARLAQWFLDPGRGASDSRAGAGEHGKSHAIWAHVTLPAGTPLRAREWQDFLRGLVAGRLDVAPMQVDFDANLYELGLQSSELLELASVLGRCIGQDLPPTLLFEYTTLKDLAGFLASCPQPEPAPKGDGAAEPVRTQLPAREETLAPKPRSVPARASAPPAARDIAIISMSGRFPRAESLQRLWEQLLAGRDCITSIPPERWDADLHFSEDRFQRNSTCCKWGGFIDGVDEFDAAFFGLSAQGATLLDPQCRLFLQTVWELLESGGYTRETLRSVYGGRVGLYVGSMFNHYGAVHADAGSAAIISVTSDAAIANRTSHFFGLQGPSIAIDTMCSSAMTAIDLACKDLILGECDLAIAGGVNLSLHPAKYIGLSQAQLVASSPGSRSFTQGDGYLPAETVGAVLLKPLARAVEDRDRILAVIKATGVRHGGGSNGYTVPDPKAQAQLIEEVLAKAGADARTVSYVEAAACGVPLADAIEVSALDKVFRRHEAPPRACALGSVKSNIGHAEAASAMGQLAKVILQMKHRTLVPSIVTERLNADLRLDSTAFHLLKAPEDWSPGRPRRALVNSFGAGGAYASALVEEYVPEESASAEDFGGDHGSQIVVASARDADRLRAVVAQLVTYVEQHESLSLPDFAHTLQTGREAMECRAAFVARDRAELLRAMRAFLARRTPDTVATSFRELISGEAGNAMADLLIASGDVPKLALLWEQGGSIAWERLHQSPRRKLDLPTYPFRKDRYWGSFSAAPDTHEPEDPVGRSSFEEIQEHIAGFLSHALGLPREQLRPDKPLSRYGVDSILGLQLARHLTQRFAVKVSSRALMEHPTLHSLAQFIAENQPESPSTTPLPSAVQLLEQFRAGVLSRGEIEKLINEGSLR
jgi:phthiocerol/phenolphthiocerol synthesis type-I polyketide synthase A